MSKMGSHDPFGYRWKALDEGYNFALDLISIRGLHTKIWGPQSRRNPNLGVLGQNAIWMWAFVERHRVYYKREGGGFPQVQAVVSLVSLSLPMAHPNTKNVQIMH